MSPPDVWGPPIWRFFHILAENIHEEQYHSLIPQLFTLIRRTCVYLPCPECSEHATKFLAKIGPSDISNKTEFKKTTQQLKISLNWQIINSTLTLLATSSRLSLSPWANQ